MTNSNESIKKLVEGMEAAQGYHMPLEQLCDEIIAARAGIKEVLKKESTTVYSYCLSLGNTLAHAFVFFGKARNIPLEEIRKNAHDMIDLCIEFEYDEPTE